MSTSAEQAVRRYLAWIEDPDSAVDQDALEAAEAAFAAATDPIAKLHAAAAREKAASADVSAIEHDFVVHAKAYADAEQIPTSAFEALGVGVDVLKQAGFAVATPTRATLLGFTAPAVPPCRATRSTVRAVTGLCSSRPGR